MTRILVVGDIHGSMHLVQSMITFAEQYSCTSIIQVGDFGIGPWGSKDPEQKWLNIVDDSLKQVGITLKIIPGNHDNYDTINSLVPNEDGTLWMRDNISIIPRGYTWVEDYFYTFGAIGGAVSVDWPYRTPGVDWWLDEEIRHEDINPLKDVKLDVLITHDVPARVPVKSHMHIDYYTAQRAQVGREILQQAVDMTKPKMVFSGHWHQQLEYSEDKTKYTVLNSDGNPGWFKVISTFDLD
jgi:Icc-related predicted phosphoesterase